MKSTFWTICKCLVKWYCIHSVVDLSAPSPELAHHSRRKLCILIPFPSQPRAAVIPLSVRICLFWVSHVNGIVQSLFFYVCQSSSHVTPPPWFVRVVARMGVPPLFMAA